MSTLFPGSVDDSTTLPDPSSGSFTNAPSLATGQTNQNDAIKATQTKVLAEATTTAAHIANTSNPHSVTKSQVGLGNADNTSDATKQTATIAATLAVVYPVGSIYTSTVSTNPNTLFGFGTWAAFGEGRVLVGKASSGTFLTAGSTGGTETHTLTVAEMPSHTHGQKVTANTGPSTRIDFTSDTDGAEYDQGVQTYPTGGGGAHNNLQPYVVVYMWQRTA